MFYEYLHGDNGAGIGASHQTGWTGLGAVFAVLFRAVTAEELWSGGLEEAFRRMLRRAAEEAVEA